MGCLYITIFEYHNGWDAAYAIFGGGVAIFVDIELDSSTGKNGLSEYSPKRSLLRLSLWQQKSSSANLQKGLTLFLHFYGRP